MNAQQIKAEFLWLQKHPEFEERPATMAEFLGLSYLNIEEGVRDAIKQVLIEMAGTEVSSEHLMAYALAMVTGAIGIGKTTIASIVLPYLAHYVLCLKDPQKFFGLLPGSRIAFMQMSTSEDQAKEVVFGDVKARINYSPWFKKYPYDPSFKNQLRFIQKDVWILPGDSAETTFEGYNILGGILDEADSHKQTKTKDYAEQGYNTIANRMSSRFQRRGFVLVIGQMKSAAGFAARKFNEFSRRPDAYAKRMTIWESFGKEFYREQHPNHVYETFIYDSKRKMIVPAVARLADNNALIEVPIMYRPDFENDPEQALRDLAGIPPAVGDPFISLTYKLDEARDRWITRYGGYTSPVSERNDISKWFVALDSLPRVAHIDIGYSGAGDAAGIAMGHVPEMVIREGERKPFIVIDFLIRFKAQPGSEIFISDLRKIVYLLKNERKFRLKKVTLDGFQSTDTLQQLAKARFETDLVSVDKQMLPYHDLREAIYEDRIAFPQYMVRMSPGDSHLTEVLYKELSEVVDAGGKVDHPPDGSKDVADAVAGVVFTLMGDRRYRRHNARHGIGEAGTISSNVPMTSFGGQQYAHPAFKGDSLPPAPIPQGSPAWRR